MIIQGPLRFMLALEVMLGYYRDAETFQLNSFTFFVQIEIEIKVF
jgi:hypothetical protein